MKLFTGLYDGTLRAAAHRHAPLYLGGVSAAEAVFFPIPPDVMLIPLSLARPQRALWLALLTTLCSVTGGLLGYLLGWWAFDAVAPLLERAGYGTQFASVQAMFDRWGVWIVLVAGFSPVPYKLFTLASGFMGLAVLPFLLASFVGRGARFFLVAWLVGRFGPAVQDYVRDYVEIIGWTTVLALILAFVLL